MRSASSHIPTHVHATILDNVPVAPTAVFHQQSNMRLATPKVEGTLELLGSLCLKPSAQQLLEHPLQDYTSSPRCSILEFLTGLVQGPLPYTRR